MGDPNTVIIQLLQTMQQQMQQQSEQNAQILEALSNLNLHTKERADSLTPVTNQDISDEDEMLGAVSETRPRDNYPRIKAGIPVFSGSLHFEDFLDWVFEVEKFFELMNIPEEAQVRYVAFKLKGAALPWWDNAQASRHHLRKQPVQSWSKMKQLMCARFLPVDYEQTLYSQYQNCRQLSRSVTEYAEEFMRLASRNHLTESDAQQVARFNNGLHFDIQDVVSLQTTWTLDEAVRLALKAEHMFARQSKRNLSYRSMNNSSLQRSKPEANVQASSSKSIPKVAEMASSPIQPTNNAQTTKKPFHNPYARNYGNKCYHCQQTGHTSNQCRAQKSINIAEREERDDDESSEDACIIGPDAALEEEAVCEEEAYSFVVERLVLSTSKSYEDSQRHNIFWTRCKIRQDVFDVIVDSGSSENFISRDIVKQLQLIPIKHPTPYTIGWIKAVGEVRVTEQCEVSFSMGKYKDIALYDIIDMEACHILLGRPWQFDLDAVHKGKENVYTFSKDGQKFTRCPFPSGNRPKSAKEKGKKIMLCTREDFLVEAKRVPIIFVVVIKEGEAQLAEAPPKLHDLLMEFKDTMPEEISEGLPPGMVEDLLKKGLIRESKSPCAVPALLVPKKDKTWRMCIDSRAINKITVKY
ncbi:uncharacterized protein LOC120276074 [Dioscorea cayenensis subsp. rotundata]|uniref:Uncharacterized protein LOC120276074 n=1 Tax=Dioscorea cayennensis subsp. rotundata TaxID=55577 RepID=A0AB40CFZ1_DIOCR|nr:uncharacterized protein LOC120276074 [Dioscorea cayenensis subsp. rotundata]